MSVDPKIAKHICSVVRRQAERSLPGFSVHFLVHPEFGREKAYSKAIRTLSEDKVGQYIVDHFMDEHNASILNGNRSNCAILTFQKSPGFLGFNKHEKYLAFVFVNYDRFRSEEELKSHVLHLTWQAINLYHVLKNQTTREHDGYEIDHHIILPAEKRDVVCHNNLQADIFSASVQALQGKDNALDMLFRQRMRDTIQKDVGFLAEDFPFPMCRDTLEFVFTGHVAQYQKSKRTIEAALQISEDLGKTYDMTSIEQWRSFAIPAQEMAWNGHPPETVLGAAIYTAEDTFIQSIADMLAEYLKIKPEVLTSFDDYNPFAHPDVNERMHKKRCEDVIKAVTGRIFKKSDYPLLIEVADKQNKGLLSGSAMGWCVPGLLEAAERIQHMGSDSDLMETLEKARERFMETIQDIPWETLAFLSRIAVEYRRQRTEHTVEELLAMLEEYEELESVYYSIFKAQDMVKKKPAPLTSAGF
ncbi:MAG: hypothetical protein GC137_09510 [Alphaproteobacteria bacterium]|nr:hypothetical protein [Alphaproteobacteria bacterium]